MEKKREGDRKAAGEGFLASDHLYHWFFWYWGWERGAAKVALSRASIVSRFGYSIPRRAGACSEWARVTRGRARNPT
jgi:hypothetical protein